ncbi:MAG: beta-ketoacyl synthase N-terminal-like domain-containing protein, partial [Desulfobacteraceae bacterium]
KGQCSIGSVKSMIGHLLTAAGAAGMIKMLLALSHRTLPPSLKYKGPKPGSPLIDGPFRVETDARNWPRKQDGATRKAAVSAFGFGGINAHVLIEEWQDHISDRDRPAAIDISEEKSKPSPNEAIAIVGLNLQLGVLDSVNAFQEAVFNGRSAIGPVPPERWKAPKYTDQVFGSEIQGNFIDKVSVELGEFQIPPGEIPDILPQQLLMLKVAAGAMTDAGLPLRQARERMGAIIGIGFDYEATNFQLRWALPSMAARWNETSALPESGDENLNRWLHCAKDDCGSPLTATRTLGALGGIVASRIAREFRFGGPSFVVSAEEASGLQAAGIASRMLRSREVDAMLVGAVDLNCDERNMTTLYSRLGLSACAQIRPFDIEADGTLPGEGAVALVLKRLEDAKADNDRVYALLEGFGAASGVVDDHFWPDESVYLTSLEKAFKEAHADPGEIDVMECHASGVPSQDRIEAKALQSCFDIASTQGTGQSAERSIAVGTVKPIVGHTGATSGLTSLAKTALSLFHHIIPPVSHFQKPAQSQWEQGNFYFPIKPVYWARNRQEGPRRACVATMTSDGHCMHVVLGQHDTHCRHLAEPTNLHLHSRPLGALPHGLFIIQGEDKIQMGEGLARLDNLVKNHTGDPAGAMESLAHQWYLQSTPVSQSPESPLRRLAIVADSINELRSSLVDARQAVDRDQELQMTGRGGVSYDPNGLVQKGRIGFIYPGSGNHYIGMGRTLGAHWPEVLREMAGGTDQFKDQLLPRWCDPWRVDWSGQWSQAAYSELVSDPLRTIFAQVLFGGQLTHLLKKFNIHPDAVVGYSLGESAALFALGVWPDRGQMLERLKVSTLFKNELAGSFDAVRKAWKIPNDQPIDWKVAAVNRDVKTVDLAISELPYVRRLIVNTPDQCVIGGLKSQVQTAIAKMVCTAVYLDGVVAVHCDAATPVAGAYKQLHCFDTTPLQDVRFYSCAFEKPLDLTSEAAASSITQQATEGFNFPRVIERAYADGVKIFIEIGPHCSCTRMIDRILGNRPHLAVAANHRSEFEPLTLLKCLGTLAAAGVEINLNPLYGDPKNDLSPSLAQSATAIEVPVGGKPLSLTMPTPNSANNSPQPQPEKAIPDPETAPSQEVTTRHPKADPVLDLNSMIDQLNENVAATAKAHEQFLALSQELTTQYGEVFQWQNQMLPSLSSDDSHWESLHHSSDSRQHSGQQSSPTPIAFDRAQCMEFAIGSVGKMLGPEFNIIDSYGARVRLPDEPLMLVDRILSVEGEKLGLGPGRVITEHDVVAGAWYLDGHR